MQNERRTSGWKQEVMNFNHEMCSPRPQFQCNFIVRNFIFATTGRSQLKVKD
jgi:hypothetical protein